MDGSPYDRPLGHRLGKRKRGSSPADGEEVVAQRHQTRTPFPSTYSQHATGSLPFQRASGSPDHRRPACRQEFEIAIICALPLEYDAVCLLFDEFWDDHVEVYGRATGDRNTYTNGRIGKHNVVLVLLYRMGKATAAGAAASMCLSYTGLRVVFLVGICGGVPFPRDGEEIVLGDVVISKTIIQYDFGRQYPGHFARKEAVGDTLGMPSKDVRNMLALLETRRGRGRLRTKTAEYLQELQANAKRQTIGNTYAYPGVVEDKLFDADYRHKHRGYPQCICHENHGQFGSVCAKAIASSCEDLGCDESFLVPRERFRASTTERRANAHSSGDPAIHVGLVASGDTVMKSGEDRDSIAARDGIVAFEMEGAGVWDEMPSVVVKGVCDYADCHKHKRWQDFAAAAAASAMKGLLNLWLYRDDAPQPARCAGSSTDMVTADAAVRVTVRDHHVVVTLERASQTTHVIRLASDELRDQPSFHRVTVIDARGIPLPSYLETVTSKELFTHILKERFGDLGTGKIERNEWSLEDRDTGQVLDLSMPWLSLFKPNQVLFMSMIFRRRKTPSTRCPSCSFSNRGYTDTETQCKRCGLSYQRVQEIQKYEFLDAEQPTWLPSPGPSIIPPEVTGPQKPQLQTADDDISQYRRVSVIDTTFQMCKASSGDGVGSSRILLTARDLHEIEALARRLAVVSGLSVADCSTLLKDDEVTLSSIREELEWVRMPAPARGSREDYEGPANSSWADRMIFSPDTSFGEGLRVNFGDLDRSLDEANAQLRSLLEMTRPINPRAPLTRESSSSTLRPHGFADDSRLSDSTLRPFSQSLETPPSFNTWNDFLTGQGRGTAPRTAMYIPGLTEVNFVPPPLPPPRQLPFTRLSTETDNAQLDRQAVIHDKATDHDENYHPASGSPVRGGTAYHASSMANEMLKGEIEDGAGEALWLQHGRFFPSTADAHTRHTLERLNSNQEEVQAVEGIRRLG